MKFSKVGEHTIKCIISEQEIDELGYSVDDILTNGVRTQEFMNHIFDLAEQEFQMKFDMGIKTVRADFLPDHTVALTFSEHPVSGMAEHLKDIVNGILNSIPQEKWEEMRQVSAELENAGKKAQEAMEAAGRGTALDYMETVNIVVDLTFSDMENLVEFAKNVAVEDIPQNALYKYKGEYHLIMDVSDCMEKQVERMSLLADEFACNIQVGADKIAHLKEHGKRIMKAQAVEQLRQL